MSDNDQFELLWKKISETLQATLSPITYNTYISKLKAVDIDGTKIILSTDNEFFANFIGKNLTEKMKEAFQKADTGITDFELVIEGSDDVVFTTEEEEEDYSPLSVDPRFTFESFVAGKSNEFVFAAAKAVAKTPGANFNPLYIYGASGLGKTHLMHAIGHFIQDHFPNMRMLYLPSEMFTNELVSAIKNNKNVEFRNRFRNVDVLMLDDIQFIAGRDSTQEEFFHTFNALHSAGKQIIISSDKPPREIARLEERLRSRFEWGLIADIQKPDFDTRIAILRKKAENEGIKISDEMLELIAGRIESNIRELEGSLTRVNAYAKLNHCEINEEVISHALHDIAVVRDPKRITPELIIDCVSDYYGLSADALRGDSRKKEIAFARHVAVYLTREMTGMSLPRIGDAFGRDHSTIINSCDKVTKLMETKPDVKGAVADLKKIITEK